MAKRKDACARVNFGPVFRSGSGELRDERLTFDERLKGPKACKKQQIQDYLDGWKAGMRQQIEKTSREARLERESDDW